MQEQSSKIGHWMLISLFGLGLALRLAFALLPLSQHLLLLEDDAWMVTAIARNWAMGKGITADGINPTNGFHPLYPLSLGAIPYLIAPNNLDFGFTANLVICAILAALVMVPLWKLMHYLAGERAAIIAVALYALNPVMIRLTVNGMETAMALLLWMTTLWASVTWDLGKLKTNLWLALLTAAMILARLDGALLFAAIAAARFLGAWRSKRLKAELPLLISYVVATFVLLIPYFWRNLSVFSSFSPSSGQALTYLHSYADSYALSNGIDGWYVNSAFSMDVVGRSVLGAFMWLIVFAGFIIWRLRRNLGRLLPLILYMPIPLVYYGYMMQQDNPRHFVPFSLAIIIFVAWALAHWWQHQAWLGQMIAVVVPTVMIAIQILVAIHFWQEQRTTTSQTQPTMYQVALWMRDHLPQDALIGAKNSGIYQYYSGHTVINIDGKLNQDILAVYQQRRMLDYLHEKGIIYLVDRETTMADHVQFYSQQFGERPEHHVPTLMQQVQIYGQLLFKSLGLSSGPTLDRRDNFVPNRPFSTVADVIQTFPRPNDTNNPIVVFKLK